MLIASRPICLFLLRLTHLSRHNVVAPIPAAPLLTDTRRSTVGPGTREDVMTMPPVQAVSYAAAVPVVVYIALAAVVHATSAPAVSCVAPAAEWRSLCRSRRCLWDEQLGEAWALPAQRVSSRVDLLGEVPRTAAPRVIAMTGDVLLFARPRSPTVVVGFTFLFHLDEKTCALTLRAHRFQWRARPILEICFDDSTTSCGRAPTLRVGCCQCLGVTIAMFA